MGAGGAGTIYIYIYVYPVLHLPCNGRNVLRVCQGPGSLIRCSQKEAQAGSIVVQFLARPRLAKATREVNSGRNRLEILLAGSSGARDRLSGNPIAWSSVREYGKDLYR